MKSTLFTIVFSACTGCSTADDSSLPRDASPDDGHSDVSTTDAGDSGTDASGGTSGSAGDTGGGDANDAGQDVDSGEPDPVCEGLDEPTCKGTSGCIALYGQNYSTGSFGFAGCAHWCVGSTSGTCGIAPDKSCWKFSDSCVPDGWTPIYFCSSPAQCTAVLDAATESEEAPRRVAAVGPAAAAVALRAARAALRARPRADLRARPRGVRPAREPAAPPARPATRS